MSRSSEYIADFGMDTISLAGPLAEGLQTLGIYAPRYGTVVGGGNPYARAGMELAYRITPRFALGLGEAGVAALTAFVEGGGTLVCLDSSAQLAIDALKLPVSVALIFFMQAGFMLVETGFCRAKNAAPGTSRKTSSVPLP